MSLDHVDPRWQAPINTRFWKSQAKKWEIRKPLLSLLWCCRGHCWLQFLLSVQPQSGVKHWEMFAFHRNWWFFFLSWLDCYFLFNLPSRKLTTKHMACPQGSSPMAWGLCPKREHLDSKTAIQAKWSSYAKVLVTQAWESQSIMSTAQAKERKKREPLLLPVRNRIRLQGEKESMAALFEEYLQWQHWRYGSN